MAKKARRPKKEGPEFNPLDELYSLLVRKVDGVPVGEGKRAAIVWGIVAAVLIAGSSVLFAFGWLGPWVPAIIGAPAGVILFMICFGVVRRTSVGEWSVFEIRETNSYKQRMKKIILWFGVYALIFIPLGRYIPYGLGGASLILLVLTAIIAGRRTPQELEWAKQGVPDPRDLEDEEKDAYADEEAAEAAEPETEADKIYYDEQRGGFGGKLK